MKSEDIEVSKICSEDMKKEMLKEMDNVSDFIKLLQSTDSILMPTTSGEETTYMYKTPMDQHLKCKLKVMKAHLNDEPGGYGLSRDKKRWKN